ncbi:MAG TPA: TIGR00282 family metallophosphoesterase [Phycisphaerae bacterium]|nr:TIGR00282 family metallophosphoesterase [Phycisphaerae bacterium]HNU46658.1 TIGR00282 family metallophosphoesterase [Phycisphaerae bacterium]
MDLKLLCAGDVVGEPGRRVLREAVERLRRDGRLDCAIVNAENAAGGSGLTPVLYDKILQSGVDLITLGDHAYRRNEIFPILETKDRLVRPINFPAGAPGREYALAEVGTGQRVAVLAVMGRLYMKPPVDCPFRAVDRVLAALPADVKIIVVDVHAEATSEKIALGWHLDGRVSVVFGTHTHVQTADECVLPKGTAYITDVGMTGPHDSVLGRRKDRVLGTMISGVPSKFEVACNDPRLCGVLVTVDAHTGRAKAIERVQYKGSAQATDGYGNS